MTRESARWVYGVHAVVRRLEVDPRSVLEVQVVPGTSERLAHLRRLVAAAGISLRETDDETLRRITGTAKHRGVAGRTRPFEYGQLERLLERAPTPVLMLDQIQDPHNFGALLRTAAAAGVSGVVIPRHGAVGVTPVVEKVAAGATNDVTVCRVANLSQALKQLKAQGYWSVALVPAGGRDLFEVEVPYPWVLVVGGEQGVRPLVERTCDIRVSIPMERGVESLNASVAGAVALYELRRRSHLT